MKLVICNKGGGSFVTNAKRAATSELGEANVTVFEAKDNPNADMLRGFTHIVGHLHSTESEEPSWPNLMSGDLTNVKVIIRVSSVGTPGMTSFGAPFRHKADGPWVLHLHRHSGDFSEQEWKALFAALKDWTAGSNPLPVSLGAIFNSNDEAKFALRLLCEAWKATQGKASAEVAGITIYAPTKPEQWQAPFETKDDIAKAAAPFGNAQKEATALFQAVGGTDKEELRKRIDAFLDATTKK
ncbi:MAG TPA: hypothetical protein PLX89_04810 [Verrucomicrobiota bacterium]|nr:hypothetical protein [Verrucomicrobiota bacterium]